MNTGQSDDPVFVLSNPWNGHLRPYAFPVYACPERTTDQRTGSPGRPQERARADARNKHPDDPSRPDQERPVAAH